MTHDVHQHVWPPGMIEVLRSRREPPLLDDGLLVTEDGPFPLDVGAHLPEARLALLDREGIDVALVSLQPTLAPSDDVVDAYHEGIAEAASARLRPLAYATVLDGFAGASLPAGDLLDLDRVAPLLDELDRRSQILFVHPGTGASRADGPVWWDAVVGYTAQMQSAFAMWLWQGAERWPRLRVLFALLAGGAPFQLERLAARGLDVRRALAGEVYLDTSSYGPRALEFCFSLYGVDRLVHGSDSPVLEPRSSLRAVRSFGEAVTTALCHDNPSRLLA